MTQGHTHCFVVVVVCVCVCVENFNFYFKANYGYINLDVALTFLSCLIPRVMVMGNSIDGTK